MPGDDRQRWENLRYAACCSTVDQVSDAGQGRDLPDEFLMSRPRKYKFLVTLKSGPQFLAVALAENPVEVWAWGIGADETGSLVTRRWARGSVAKVESLPLFWGNRG